MLLRPGFAGRILRGGCNEFQNLGWPALGLFNQISSLRPLHPPNSPRKLGVGEAHTKADTSYTGILSKMGPNAGTSSGGWGPTPYTERSWEAFGVPRNPPFPIQCIHSGSILGSPSSHSDQGNLHFVPRFPPFSSKATPPIFPQDFTLSWGARESMGPGQARLSRSGLDPRKPIRFHAGSLWDARRTFVTHSALLHPILGPF